MGTLRTAYHRGPPSLLAPALLPFLLSQWLLLALFGCNLQQVTAHGTHGIFHVVTLHWMSWLGAFFTDIHWSLPLVGVVLYFLIVWYLYRRLVDSGKPLSVFCERGASCEPMRATHCKTGAAEWKQCTLLCGSAGPMRILTLRRVLLLHSQRTRRWRRKPNNEIRQRQQQSSLAAGSVSAATGWWHRGGLAVLTVVVVVTVVVSF